MEKCATLHIFPAGGKNFWWKFLVEISGGKKFSKVKRRCFNDAQDPIGQDQLKNQIYLLRFSHTRALLLKKSDAKRPFSPPCRNWPIYIHILYIFIYIFLLPSGFGWFWSVKGGSILGIVQRARQMQFHSPSPLFISNSPIQLFIFK